ncbi:MAG: glutaredoxin family protein [Nitrososphaerota archaeon]|nr:glutaredoxin family protein [Nitrososphaerota archaeon]
MPEHPSFGSDRWLSKSELESSIVNSGEPKIAVFAAKWCGFCKRFIELITKYNHSGPLPISIIDADSDDGSLWEKYRIDIVPTIVVFKGGKKIFRQGGRSMRGLNENDLEAAKSRLD